MIPLVAFIALFSPGLLQGQGRLIDSVATAQAAMATGQYCRVAQIYQSAIDQARRLGDRSAQSAAALNLAEALPKVVSPCEGVNQTPELAYDLAIRVGDPDLQAVAYNSRALFLWGLGDRSAAITQLEQINKLVETEHGNVWFRPRDLAIYQYNLARLYEAGDSAGDFEKAIEEYKKALRNRPDYMDAAADVFNLLKGAEGLKTPVSLQGAEIATLMIEAGQAEAATNLVLDLLESVAVRPQAEILLGALVRAYLALPLSNRDSDMRRLKLITNQEQVRQNNRPLIIAIDELVKAYSAPSMPAYRSEQEAARDFAGWIRGPLPIATLSRVLQRRGENAEREQDNVAAISFSATAWYLDPENTGVALRCAALMHAEPSLPQNEWLSEQILNTYLPPTSWYRYLIEPLIDAPQRIELRLRSDDWKSIERIYTLLGAPPREEVMRKIRKNEQTLLRLENNEKKAALVAPDGARSISGSTVGTDANAVEIDVITKNAETVTEDIKEIAVANVEPTTNRYSAYLLSALSPGSIVKVYPIRFGQKSESPLVESTVSRSHFGNLRHIDAFLSSGVEIARDHSSQGNESVTRSSLTLSGTGSFRFKNRGQPYLPKRQGYLISLFGGFSLTPFALSSPGGGVVHVAHARSFELGLYTPLYADFVSWFWKGYPHSVFIAPVTAAGFHAAGTNGKLFYKYGSAGIRMGFFRFSRYGEKVPELRSHIDVTAGRWENLSAFRSGHQYTPTRLQIEGQFIIPTTPLYVGFRRTAGVRPNDQAITLGIRVNFSRPLSLILPLDR